MADKQTRDTLLDRIGWAVLFAGLIALVARRWIPGLSAAVFNGITYGGWAVAGLGGLLLVYANRTDLLAASKTRQAKYGANSLLLTVSVLGIIALGNYLGTRYHWRTDLTEAKTFSLSEQTKQILDTLPDEVTVTVFYQENNPSLRQVKDLLGNYTYYSKKLKVAYIDPDRQPAVAQKYGVERYGTIIFEKGDRKEKLTAFGEQDFTSALIKLIKPRETKVYLVEGHGELNVEEFGDKGISRLKEALGKDHYRVEALSIPAKQAVPADADVAILAGPRHPYTPKEVEALSAYLERGGKLLVLVDPGVTSGLDGLLKSYGVSLGNDVVIDPLQHAWSDASAPAVNRYRFHDITKSMNGFLTVFPRARSVQVAPSPPPGAVANVLAETSPAGWGETELKNPQVRQDAADTKGPVPLAVAVNKDAPKGPKKGDKPAQTRLVVLGSSAMVANGMLNANVTNSDLALNAVNWLAQEESLISIRPKPPASRVVTFTGGQMSAITTVSVLALPAAVLALGAFIWYRRR